MGAQNMNVLLHKDIFKTSRKFQGNDYKKLIDFIGKFNDNPAHPSISLERINRTADRNLWSARISRDLRAIVYKEGDTWALVHADHHDDAYHWAEHCRVAFNLRTGALQIIESTTTVEAQLAPPPADQPALFADHDDDYLLSLGLPDNWLPVTRKLLTQDDLFQILDRLPEEVAERLMALSEGEIVAPPPIYETQRSTNDNLDTQRRFVLVRSTSELAKLLDSPMAEWIGFLHPTQRRLATGHFNGPLKVIGSAGTGKTVVALHRARHLARQGHRVLISTFVGTLCENIRYNLKLLCTEEELAQIEVETPYAIAGQILQITGQTSRIVYDADLRRDLETMRRADCPLDANELWLEWTQVIQPQAIATWDEYRKAKRIGRGKPLNASTRKRVWQSIAPLFQRLQDHHQIDPAGFFRRAREAIAAGDVARSFDAVIVDEVQDLSPQALKFLATLAGDRPNAFTLVGDGGQRIYQSSLPLKSLGIDTRGRSHILRVNYRTTEQIRRFADHLTATTRDDLDGNPSHNTITTSLLQGAEPTLHGFPNQKAQTDFVVAEVTQLMAAGLPAAEIGIFARTHGLLKSVENALERHGIPVLHLDRTQASGDGVRTATMHRAKGLEFRAVLAIALDDQHLPLPQSLQAAVDEQAYQQAIEHERNLLYVSLTRARELAYAGWYGQPCSFLSDLLKDVN